MSIRGVCEWIIVLALVDCGLCHEISAGEGIGLGVRAGVRVRETMSFSDSRPTARMVTGGGLGFRVAVSEHWRVVASGDLMGSWFEFRVDDPFVVVPTMGKIEDIEWVGRVGFERVLRLGRNVRATAGFGGQYGEARSWFRGLSAKEEGPRSFNGGGYAAGGVAFPVLGPLLGSIDLTASVYRSHARRPRYGDSYDWLGEAVGLNVGLQYEL